MCGILGIVSTSGDRDRFGGALEALRHRGPDSSGSWNEGPITLGHTRLAIVDLSEHGHQPMFTSDGRYALVFNGEIYNHVELRAELAALGHVIVSTGDSEVILHAYEQWGSTCVERFNGMWAFAIWDRREKHLFCSRDRFGVKPFYFATTRHGFAFASEIKALLALDHGLAVPDEATVFRFLYNGLLDEDDATFFRDIRQLPASHNMVVYPDGGHRLSRYYAVAEEALSTDVLMADASEHLRELMTDAVRLRLRADVPVGTCLSGGLDSTTIVGLADGLMDRRISSFTSVYPGTDADEGAFARAAVELYQTDAHWVEPRKEDFFAVLPRIVWHQDEPTSAPGLYSQWHVMQLAHGKVKVLLDGQGGDEILGGYLGYYAEYAAALLEDVAHGRVDRLTKLMGEYDEIKQQLGGRSPVGAAMQARLPDGARSLYRRIGGLRKHALIDAELLGREGAGMRASAKPDSMRDPLNSSLVDSLTRATIPALLHYEDRNSMAFSIEARTPFLDYRLVQFALAIPYEAKIRGWETKVILREAMQDILPPSILERRDKKGYPTPLALWLRTGLMSGTREILLSSECTGRGLTNMTFVERMLDEHESGRADHHWQIWRLLTLELWFRTFIDSQGDGPVAL